LLTQLFIDASNDLSLTGKTVEVLNEADAESLVVKVFAVVKGSVLLTL